MCGSSASEELPESGEDWPAPSLHRTCVRHIVRARRSLATAALTCERRVPAYDGGGLGWPPVRWRRRSIRARNMSATVPGTDTLAECPRSVTAAPGQLLQEEGIPRGLLDNSLGERHGNLILRCDVAHEGEAGPGREARHRELGHVGVSQPRHLAPGAIGHQQQDPRAGDRVDQGRQVLSGGGIDPLEILHHEDQRTLSTQTQPDPSQRLEGPELDRLSALLIQRLRPGLHAEEVEEIRRRRLGLDPE